MGIGVEAANKADPVVLNNGHHRGVVSAVAGPSFGSCHIRAKDCRCVGDVGNTKTVVDELSDLDVIAVGPESLGVGVLGKGVEDVVGRADEGGLCVCAGG